MRIYIQKQWKCEGFYCDKNEIKNVGCVYKFSDCATNARVQIKFGSNIYVAYNWQEYKTARRC